MVVQNETRAEIDATIDALFGPPKDTETAKEDTTRLRAAAKSIRQGERANDGLPLDRPNIRAVVSVELRISGVSQCLKRLYYEAKRTEPSDEIPARNRAMMRMGAALEPMVKEMMREDGWEFGSEHVAVEMPHGRIILTGHPDGVMSHPMLTDGQEAVVEIKTRSAGAAKFAWDFGVERSHPEAVRQAALYSKALFGEVGEVFIATLSRDDGEHRVERIPADRAQQAYEAAMGRIGEIGGMVLRDRLPEAEYPQGDARCQSCPYRTLCGNTEVAPQVGEGGLTDEEVRTLVREWAQANAAAPKSSSPAAKAKRDAASALKAHMLASGDYEDEVLVDGAAYRLKLSESVGRTIDFEALNELVAPEVREQVVKEKVSSTFRVTPLKR